MNPAAAEIVARLGLLPLPREGGFFRRTWQSTTQLPNGRAASSSILFLLTPDDFSSWHRLRSDELWSFHDGDPIELVQLDAANGSPRATILGTNWSTGEVPQCSVPENVWQAARLKPAGVQRGWALVGCTVTPAWDEKEFELGRREIMLREFPGAADWIRALTR
ncbi:MAG: cupin [Verrucomicrobia bacterium]|nr:cupin [Verrucomicrobiota bacterium]